MSLMTPADAAREVLREIEQQAGKLNKRDRRKFYRGLSRWFMGQRSPAPNAVRSAALGNRRPPSGQ